MWEIKVKILVEAKCQYCWGGGDCGLLDLWVSHPVRDQPIKKSSYHGFPKKGPKNILYLFITNKSCWEAHTTKAMCVIQVRLGCIYTLHLLWMFILRLTTKLAWWRWKFEPHYLFVLGNRDFLYRYSQALMCNWVG